jgi:hypothetical protein
VAGKSTKSRPEEGSVTNAASRDENRISDIPKIGAWTAMM